MQVGSMITAKFATMNKNNTLREYKKECKKPEFEEITQEGGNGYPSFKHRGANWRIEKCKVVKYALLSSKEFNFLTKNFLSDNEELYEKIGGHKYTGTNPNFDYQTFYMIPALLKDFQKNNVTLVVVLENETTKEKVAINTEGYNYARYVGIEVKEV